MPSAITHAYKKACQDGLHQPGHTYKIALYTAAGVAALSASTTAYTASGEVTGAGYTAGGLTLSGRSSTLASGTAKLTFAPATWTGATITARGALIYNDTLAGKDALCVIDFGSDVTSTAGTWTFTPDSNGLLNLS